MDPKLKKQIIITQIKLLKAIQSHKVCFEKLENGNRTDELIEEMVMLKRQMFDCQNEQNCLLEQLNSSPGAPFRFQLYDIPYSALQKKNNRRKALMPSVETKTTEKERDYMRTPSPDVFLPTDLQCSDESEDDDDEDVISSQPVPLPVKSSKPTHLLPKPTRRPRNYKTDSGPMKELPVYFDPPPSPEPIDEIEAKNKYMRSLNLLTKEALAELLTKKNERKRRSTANSHYAYSKDYELPAVKRKQYLSPVKKSSEENKIPEKKAPSEEEAESSKSPSPTPDIDESSLMKCNLCNTPDNLISCLDCNELFHAKCPAVCELERSFLTCHRCKCVKTPTSLDEAAVNFQAQDLSESDADSNGANIRATHMEGRLKIREHLMKILRCRMIEKNQMESMVLQLSDNLHFQTRMKNNLEENSNEIMGKIEQLRNFVKLYQMHNGKDTSPASPMVTQDEPHPTLPHTSQSQSDVDSLSQTSEDSLSISSNCYLQEPLKKCIKLSF